MNQIPIGRRHFLAGSLGTAALLSSGGFLTACSSGQGGKGNSVQDNAGVKLPTYIPFTGVRPDLPGTAVGVDAAFKNYPRDRPRSVARTPGAGETVTAMCNTFFPAPPGPDRNSFWAGLNKRLGVNLDLQIVPSSDYDTKFTVAVAGNELPDMMQTSVGSGFPRLLESKFQNLTEHLSGDAVKDYPNLANLPSMPWKAAIFNGGIYAIPVPRGAVGGYPVVRKDLYEAAGVSTAPRSYGEFVDGLKALTQPRKNKWAFALATEAQWYVNTINEVPNGWHQDGGKLTHAIETEEWRRSVENLADLWKLGVIHPDGYFGSSLATKNLFGAGTTALQAQSAYTGWMQYYVDNKANPDFEMEILRVPKRDGGGLAAWPVGKGYYSLTALKKADPERIKLLLRVLDWLAAPFGSEEFFYRSYGTEGVDHTLDASGNPTLTAKGAKNTLVPTGYLSLAPWAIYTPGRPADADLQHKYQSTVIPLAMADPSVGLWSDTSATKGKALNKAVTSDVGDVMQGRKPLSALSDTVATWRKNGGDAIRAEFEEQLQSQGRPR